MRQKYTVMDLQKPERFDLRLALDKSLRNIEANLNLASERESKSRLARYGLYSLEAVPYIAAIAYYVINPYNNPDELKTFFSTAIGGWGLAFTVRNRITGIHKRMGKDHKEYSRRHDALKDRLEQLLLEREN